MVFVISNLLAFPGRQACQRKKLTAVGQRALYGVPSHSLGIIDPVRFGLSRGAHKSRDNEHLFSSCRLHLKTSGLSTMADQEPTPIQQSDDGLKEVADLLTRSKALTKFVRDEVIPQGTTTIGLVPDDDEIDEDAPDELTAADLTKLGSSVNGIHLAIVALGNTLTSLAESLRSNEALLEEEEARLANIDQVRINAMEH